MIEPGGGAPPLVCLGWTKYESDTDQTESGILHHTDDVSGFLCEAFAEVVQKNGRIVNQNIPFDFAVVCHAHPELLPAVFDLYDRRLVEDTMLREQLFDIAKGALKRNRHSLQAIAKKRLGIDMDKVTWRTGYDKLYGVPLAEWPEGAKQYAIDDTQIAIDVYMDQRREVLEDEESGEVPNSVEQARAHWALYLMTTWGIRTDGAKVSVFKRELEIHLSAFEKALKKVGFIRENGTKDLKAIRGFLEGVKLPEGVDLARTEKGAVSTSATALEDLLDALGERLVPDKKKDGRLPVEWALELAQHADKVHSLELLAWHTSTQKLLSTYIPPLEQGAKHPVNARYRPLVETGRASCSSPNLMNLPKEPGVRECYVPRPGFVFCSVDYEALELHTLAQACLQLVGSSRLAEALNNGVDPHLALACEHLLQGVSYEEGKSIRKNQNHPRYKEVVHARNVSKCANFGLPGGLGIKKLVAFCKASGIEITEDQAYNLKKAWLSQWPEMRDYFRMISNSLLVDEEGEEFTVVEQLVSSRVRGNTRYTAACNSYFQGLAADLAKEACYAVAKACYVKGENDILYGSRSVVFIHDEIIMEHPEETAHERAFEQARLMVEAGKPFCPDVPLKAEPALMRYWTKDAVEVYRDGRLVPWSEGA